MQIRTKGDDMMPYRYLAPIGLGLILTLALWSTGLAQRNGQQTRTQSYTVVIQVGPATPAVIPSPPAEIPGEEVAPPEEMAPPEEVLEPVEEEATVSADE